MKRTIESAANPKFANTAGTLIELHVKFAEFAEIHPFGASPNDVEPHGKELYARAMAGEFGPIAPYVARVPTQAEINSKADATVRQLSLDALPDVIDVLTKMATGPDKAVLKVHDDKIKAEKAKKA